ncbi:hypothetical protein GCM10027039_29240 [Terrabacter koreensis]
MSERPRPDSTSVQRPPALGVLVVIGLLTLAAAWFTVIGSDALWLSALGDDIRSTRAIPNGIPFAAAPSDDWVNTTALGQVVFSLLHQAGSVGVVVAQVVVVAAILATLATNAVRWGAGPSATSVALVAVAVGAAPPLLIARAQLLSLLPYAVLLVLIRRDHERPSSALWWSVPLVAVWSNLHGAVLAGVAVLGCYLTFSRLRRLPFSTVGLGVAVLAATCLNPGLLRAPSYYARVFGGEATRDDSGMWSRLTLSNPFDILLVLAVVVLGAMAFSRRRPTWEYVAAGGLAVATVSAARHGIWLVLLLEVPAAVSRSRATRGADGLMPAVPAKREWRTPTAVALVAFLMAIPAVLALRAPQFQASDYEAAQVASATSGQVTLVAEPFAESLAAAGAKVWASNPLDAFPTADQAAYLAFMRGDSVGAERALAGAEIVVARPGSAQARMAVAAGMTQGTTVAGYSLFTR